MDIIEVSSDYKDFKYLSNLFVNELEKEYEIIAKDYNNFCNPESMERIVLGYLNGEPIACGGYKIFDEITIEIRNMFILEECRNHGYSNHILHSLETKSKELGYIAMITILNNKQEKAIDFYLRNGFKIVTDKKLEISKDNCILMEKKI